MIFYKKLKLIQAMTFDLDDTLYENSSVIKKADAELWFFMHQAYPETQSLAKTYWRQIQKELLKANPKLKNDMGQLRLQALKLGFKRLGYGQSKTIQAAEMCFERFYFHRSDFSVAANIHNVLSALAEKLPLVAITNGNVNVQQIGIADYFTACYRASLDSPMKPHRSMFDAAQSLLAVPSTDILHVGDNLEKDVYGAIKAGYQAAWYAEDRVMSLNSEHTLTLPHVQLQTLDQLLDLIF